MRGTCAVIAMVLLVVLAAHLQREENQREDEDPTAASAGCTPSDGCRSSCEAADDADAASADHAPTLAIAGPSPAP